MCASEIGKRNKRVLLIERNSKLGSKILISGGGRCNFTNLHVSPDLYISDNAHFQISALSQYTNWDFIDLVERNGILYHEKALGQLFCDGSAKQIVHMLLNECVKANVDIRTSSTIEDIRYVGNEFNWNTSFGNGSSDSIVIATGGLSIPKIGATGFAYDIASQFGILVNETRPGLVPLVFQQGNPGYFPDLSGVSLKARVYCNGYYWDENILFTHKGLSGPAILQASSYWTNGDEIELDLVPNVTELHDDLTNQKEMYANLEIGTVLGKFVPKRLAKVILGTSASRRMRSVNEPELKRIASLIKHYITIPTDTDGYRSAEVTIGGVNTKELSSKTMESKNNKGLYFIGESVDVTGPLGGYNFQWAWSSGFAAGQAA
jgi:predicted Rossmann fold flavoprotein